MTSIILSQPNDKLKLMSICQIDYIIQSSDVEAMERYHWPLKDKLEYAIEHHFNKYIFLHMDEIWNDNIFPNPYAKLIGYQNNLELINLIIEKNYRNILISCIYGAVVADHVDTTKILINFINEKYIDGSTINFHNLIMTAQNEACDNGSINVLVYLIDKYGHLGSCRKLLNTAFYKKYISILQYLEKVCCAGVISDMKDIGICSSNLIEDVSI